MESIILPGSAGKNSILHLFDNNSTAFNPVLFIHGYKGFALWGSWTQAAEQFNAAGMPYACLDFSHNGMTGRSPDDVFDAELFGRNRLSWEVDETIQALKYLYNRYHKSPVLIGHSRGGAISILSAAEFDVYRLITWASVCDYHRRFPQDDMLEAWRTNGVRFVENARTKQQLPHYFSFYQDFDENRNRLDVLKAAENMKAPWLIIHGTADEAVSFQEAETLKKTSKLSVLMPVIGANHVFGTTHPVQSGFLPHHFAQVVAGTVNFITSV
jgi:pimeloyl-ACP methyl ester carboxylesterase